MKLGWPIWSPAHAHNTAQFAGLQNIPDFSVALWQEIQIRWGDFQRGIQKYHANPFVRPQASLPIVWQRGTTRVYDYGGSGQPLLVIPSLVNKAYVLDLLPDKSLLRFLSSHGWRPYLVDWDVPGEAEKSFGLSDYIHDRLLPIYDFLAAQFPQTPAVMGYCMGGNLALALAQLANRPPAALVLMATAWDFHAPGMPKFTQDMAEKLMLQVDRQNELPVDWLQTFFTALDPFGSVQKFMKFAAMDDASEAARLFVVLEDWLSDGVPLTRQVARETMEDWYARNTPMRGEWRVRNVPIHPASLRIPTLAVLPLQDRIVSPASAAALAARIPGALSLTPDLGHIGMMASRDAQSKVWEPLAGWLNNIR